MAGKRTGGRRRYEKLLAEFDEALAAGQLNAGELPTQPEEDPNLAIKLDRGKECLRWLEKVWPRGDSVAGKRRSGSSGGPRDADEGREGLPPDFQDFRLVREIGRGGMGVVYEAEQLSLGRRVALKVVSACTLLDKRQLRRFHNESRAAAALNHPHIVKVYAVGSERGVPYYAMQLIAGCSLAEWIANLRGTDVPPQPERPTESGAETSRGNPADSAPVSPLAEPSSQVRAAEFFRRVARLGIQACEALEHAHTQGVVHRDIKPANLLIDSDDRLWVADFGLARMAQDPGMTTTGDLLGTLRYMSPEQAAGKRLIDHRTDIYSLGATLFEMIAWEPMLPVRDRASLLRMIFYGPPRSLRSVVPSVPPDLETIILKATSREPADRYESIQQFLEDLQRFLEHKPIAARRPSLADRSTKWMRRNSVPLTASLLSAALVLSVALLLVWQQRQQAVAAAARANRLAEEMRERVYASDMKLADQAWWDHDPRYVTDILRRHLPVAGERDLRGFVWHSLWKQSQGEPIVVRASDQDLYSVAYSRDGTRLAVAGKAAVIRVYDARSYQLLTEFSSEQGEVNCVAFSPDGLELATSGDDGTTAVWVLETRRRRLAIASHPGKAYGVVFSRDGSRLYTCGEESSVHVWQVRDGDKVASYSTDTSAMESLSLSPDGRQLAAATRDGVVVWNIPQGTVAWKSGYIDRIYHTAFSPDGSSLAAASGQSRVLISNLRSSDPWLELSRLDPVLSVAFGPFGRVIYASDRGGGVEAHAWTGKVDHNGSGNGPGQPARHWHAHDGRAYGVAVSPDGDRLATVGSDGHLKTWPLLGTDFVKRVVQGTPVSDIAPAHQGADVVLSTGNRVEFLSEGVHVLSPLSLPSPTKGVACSPDGMLLAVDTEQGDVLIANRLTGQTVLSKRVEPSRHPDLAFSPTNGLLAMSSFEQGFPVVLLDVRSGDIAASFPSAGAIGHPAFSPDGARLAFTSQNDVVIQPLAARRPPRVLRGHSSTVNAVQFNPDGKLLATVSNDREVMLWDADSGRLVWTNAEHTAHVSHLVFSPDGRTLATSDGSGTIKLWSVSTGQSLSDLIRAVPANPGIDRLVFSRDGRRLYWLDYHGEVWMAGY